MRKLWIKFEDKYGMFTLWNIISHTNLKEDTYDFMQVQENVFVSNAIGNHWIKTRKSEIAFAQKQGITDIIYIIDLDNTAGHKDKLLEVDTLQEVKKRVVESMHAVNITVWFIPIVYAAESIFLLQYIKEDTESLEGLVSSFNTTKLHLKLLKLFSGCRSDEEVKRVSSFLNTDRLVQRIQAKKPFKNLLCYDWILNSCTLSQKYLINIDQFISLVSDIDEYFNYKKLNTTLDLLGEKVDLTKVINTFNIRVDQTKSYALSVGPKISEIKEEVTAMSILDNIL